MADNINRDHIKQISYPDGRGLCFFKGLRDVTKNMKLNVRE